MKQLCVPMLMVILWIPCLVLCLPASTRKGEGYSPCLVDGDCLPVQHCQWLPMALEPNGWCVFGYKVTSRGRDEYHRYKRFRRTTYSEDSLVGDGINQQTNDMQHQVRGVNDPNKMNYEDYSAIYNEHGLPNQGRYMSRTENQPMLDQVDEDGIHPQNSNSEFVINEDNTRDVYELNNDNDINRIYIPPQRSLLGLYLNGGSPDRMDSRNQLQDYDGHQNKANGMEEDVGFADDVVHDPLELAAAAEAAAIRDGDDLPDDFDHSNGLGWKGGDEV